MLVLRNGTGAVTASSARRAIFCWIGSVSKLPSFREDFQFFYIWALLRFGSLALFGESQTLGKPFRRTFQIPAIPGVSDRGFRR